MKYFKKFLNNFEIIPKYEIMVNVLDIALNSEYIADFIIKVKDHIYVCVFVKIYEDEKAQGL